MKKQCLLFLSIILSMAGCGRDRSGGGEAVDKTRSQLYVHNFDGGYGHEWLTDLKAAFEQKYKETSFEEGKKGVQVLISNDKTTGDNLLKDIPGSNYNVYFCESVFYYDYLAANVMADISDVVNTDLSAWGDTGTILDKFSEQQKSYFKASDNKYYGIPHYEGFFGITYDIKLWNDEKLYIAADPDKSEEKVDALYDGDDICTVRNLTQTKSKGPDGVAGTSDDGFPATYKELADLMVIMKAKNVVPFSWTGKYQGEYNNKLMAALTADYEGAEQTKILFNFEGTATNLVESISTEGEVTKKAPTEITEETGYKTFGTAGRYYALKFMEQIVKDSHYYGDKSFKNTESHTEAQQTYLLSNPEQGLGKSPIAMFPEGNYWENEAANSGTFEFAAKQYGNEWSRENRQIKMLPFPKATDELVGSKTTLLSTLNSLCFINKNSTGVKLELAKLFLIMANTNESLANFNVKTNAPKAISYTLSPEQYAQLNMYGKSVYDLYHNSDVVQEISTNRVFINNTLELEMSASFVAKVGGQDLNNLVKEMCPQYTPNSKNSKTLFAGLSNHFSASYWDKFIH